MFLPSFLPSPDPTALSTQTRAVIGNGSPNGSAPLAATVAGLRAQIRASSPRTLEIISACERTALILPIRSTQAQPQPMRFACGLPKAASFLHLFDSVDFKCLGDADGDDSQGSIKGCWVPFIEWQCYSIRGLGLDLHDLVSLQDHDAYTTTLAKVTLPPVASARQSLRPPFQCREPFRPNSFPSCAKLVHSSVAFSSPSIFISVSHNSSAHPSSGPFPEPKHQAEAGILQRNHANEDATA